MTQLISRCTCIGKRTTQQAHLQGDERVRFVRRVITRDGSAGGEDHRPASEEEFEEAMRAGAFALHWQAHGFRYGIPTDIDLDISSGRTVVANASRTIIANARRRYENLIVASITADTETLAARLRKRNRESDTEILRRLERAAAFTPAGQDVVEIDNTRPLAESTAAFLELLQEPRSDLRETANDPI